MCGYAPTPARAKAEVASAAATLLRHLGLARRLKAEIQDLSSRQATVPIVALAPKAGESRRASRPVSRESERDAA